MSEAKNILEKNLRQAIKESAFEIQEEARDNHNYKAKTGTLERSVQTRFTSNSGEIYLDKQIASYGAFVHQGTKAHKIFPKNKKTLRFIKGNKFIFSKYVNHPGTKKDDFLFRAVKNKEEKINKIFKRYTGKMLTEVVSLDGTGINKTYTWK